MCRIFFDPFYLLIDKNSKHSFQPVLNSVCSLIVRELREEKLFYCQNGDSYLSRYAYVNVILSLRWQSKFKLWKAGKYMQFNN